MAVLPLEHSPSTPGLWCKECRMLLLSIDTALCHDVATAAAPTGKQPRSVMKTPVVMESMRIALQMATRPPGSSAPGKTSGWS